MTADGGVRTAERQRELFKEGKTKADGYNRLSNHQLREGQEYGRAVDFYAYLNGHASWQKHHLAMVAAHILATANRLRRKNKINIPFFTQFNSFVNAIFIKRAYYQIRG